VREREKTSDDARDDVELLVQPIPRGVTFSKAVSKLKARSSKLERLFSLKRGKRDVRALSFEL